MRDEIKDTMLGDHDIQTFGLHFLGDGPVDDIYYEAMGYRFAEFVVYLADNN